MTTALQRLVADQQELLAPGEHVVAAGRARTVAGTQSAALLPTSMIWAVSQTRLFVFDSQSRTRRGLGEPVILFEIGTTIDSARVEPFDDRDVLLVVEAAGHPASVVMEAADATAIVDLITKTIAATRSDDLSATDLAGSTEGSPDPADAADGDVEIIELREAFTTGDWEHGRDMIAAVKSTQTREWYLRHLTGDELVDGLERWVGNEPDSAHGYAARGANAVWRAWSKRRELGDDLFWAELRRGELDLFWALELDFDDPVVFTPLIRSARGLGIPKEELCVRFDESIRRGPGLLGAHLETLIALSPLSLGSVDEMMALVRSVAAAVPEGSPLHALVACAHLVGLDQERSQLRRSEFMSSEAIRDVELAASMSIDSAQWRPVDGDVEVFNIFAAAFAKSGDLNRAASVLARGRNIRTHLPWLLFSDGEQTYRSVAAVSG